MVTTGTSNRYSNPIPSAKEVSSSSKAVTAAALIPSFENSILALCLAFETYIPAPISDKSALVESNISVIPNAFKSSFSCKSYSYLNNGTLPVILVIFPFSKLFNSIVFSLIIISLIFLAFVFFM